MSQEPPGPPRNVRATPGYRSADVEWDPPLVGGANVTEYEIGIPGPAGPPGPGGPAGPSGLDGLSTWTTAAQLGTGTTTGVAVVSVPQRSPQVGDLVISTHASSLGFLSRITAVASPTSVSALYVATLAGGTGGGGTGPAGPAGPEGLSTWSTTAQLSSTTNTGVAPVAVSGRTPQVGDLIVSTHSASLGFLARITAVASASSVSTQYVATIRGPDGPTGPQGNAGAQGAQGNTGATGPAGPAGPGVAAGGTTGQVLAKSSNVDFATHWVNQAGGGGGGLGPTVHNVLDAPYNANRNGTADAGAAINAALLASQGTGVVFVPPGTYRLDQGLYVQANMTLWMTPNTILLRNTPLYHSGVYATGSNIEILGGRIENSAASLSAGATQAGPIMTVQDAEVVQIRGVRFGAAHDNAFMVWLEDVRRFVMSDCVVNNQRTGPGSAPGGAQWRDDGIHVGSGRGISITNCHVITNDDAISVGMTGLKNMDLRDVAISNCTLYSRIARPLAIYTESTDQLWNINVTNCAGATENEWGDGLIVHNHYDSVLRLHDINISNCHFEGHASNSRAHIGHFNAVERLNLHNVTLIGRGQVPDVVDAARIVGGSWHGFRAIRLASTVAIGGGENIKLQSCEDITMVGCDFTSRPNGPCAVYGVGSSRIRLTDCDLTGNTGAGAWPIYMDTPGGGDRYSGNKGLNPKGNSWANHQPAPWTLPPASGTAHRNPTGIDCTVIISGGTVSAVAIGGVATGQTSGAFRVPADQTITLTYSAQPSWAWFGD